MTGFLSLTLSLVLLPNSVTSYCLNGNAMDSFFKWIK